MAKAPNLVIVESPAKAKTIEKILGSSYHVLSSYGHIRDLSKTDMGIDLENDFEPNYIISEDKKKVVDTLQKAAKNADVVWLASDDDREGEAIAWHLYQVLDRDGKPTKRIAFNEITPQAIKHAIDNPREIDINLVDAQQARRVLDRIVGFQLSPILWRRIKPSLSAGRVQSVALRLICEREEQIRSFLPTSSYKITALVTSADESQPIEITADKSLDTDEEAKNFLKENAKGTIRVASVEGKPAKRSPAPPFTTSTLQQEASRKLGFSVSRTMTLAQRLYESGLITYMRTDSTNLSSLALNATAKVIKEKWGDKYHHRRNYVTKSKGAQEAHEAIRPTYIDKASIEGDRGMVALYQLIRNRTLASQMSEASYERTIVKLVNDTTEEKFTAQGEVLLFDGFLKAYSETNEKDQTSQEHKNLPPLKEGQLLETHQYLASERYTYPPARYTEASLVRNLEELGIGRPSTYAPTIQTLFQREYVRLGTSSGQDRVYNDFLLDLDKGDPQKVVAKKRKEKTGSDKGKLLPTDIGVVVTNFLLEHFPKIVDYNFTAEIEEQFDKIASGQLPWTDLLGKFYALFQPLVNEALEARDDSSRGERELGIDPKTGRKVIARIGRYGALVQIGTQDDGSEQKPLFASIPAPLSIMTITLEEALELMKLPRILGTFEEKEVRANIGRFGPYIQQGSSFVAIPKESDPFSITLEEAIGLIVAKREKDAKAILKTFAEDDQMTIREGRWGAYIKRGKENYRIPKELREKATELTYEEVCKLVANQEKPAKKKATKRKTSATKKATTTATKKKKFVKEKS